MSPSVVSGEGDGLLAAEEGKLLCLEIFSSPLCSKKFPLCSKELVALGVRGGLLRIDVGELFPETGVVLSLRGGVKANFLSMGASMQFSLNHNNYNYIKGKKLSKEIINQSS